MLYAASYQNLADGATHRRRPPYPNEAADGPQDRLKVSTRPDPNAGVGVRTVGMTRKDQGATAGETALDYMMAAAGSPQDRLRHTPTTKQAGCIGLPAGSSRPAVPQVGINQAEAAKGVEVTSGRMQSATPAKWCDSRERPATDYAGGGWHCDQPDITAKLPRARPTLSGDDVRPDSVTEPQSGRTGSTPVRQQPNSGVEETLGIQPVIAAIRSSSGFDSQLPPPTSPSGLTPASTWRGVIFRETALNSLIPLGTPSRSMRGIGAVLRFGVEPRAL